MRVSIPVAFGELVDKITILEIKIARIPDAQKRSLMRHELSQLQSVLDTLDLPPEFAALKLELADLNLKLWETEDRIRCLDAASDFGDEFITLAKAVYRLNDRRYDVKTRLSRAAGSVIEEVKSHAGA